MDSAFEVRSPSRPLLLALGPLAPHLDSVFRTGFEVLDLDPREDFAFPEDEQLLLVEGSAGTGLWTRKRDRNLTVEASALAARVLDELASTGADAVLLPGHSPLAGLERLPMLGSDGQQRKNGRSLVALALTRQRPDLPLEDTGRLHDPGLREAFVTRVYTLLRWKALEAEPSVPGLLDFHQRHKYLLRSFNLEGLRRLGKLAARAGADPLAELLPRYRQELAAVLAGTPTRKRHADVLLHLLGYFRDRLPPEQRHEILETIQAYQAGLLPLVVPITLINLHVGRLGPQYLARQHYLNPHPLELELRNHV